MLDRRHPAKSQAVSKVGSSLSNERAQNVALGKSALSPQKYARAQNFSQSIKLFQL
jgi:hypothetical protein